MKEESFVNLGKTAHRGEIILDRGRISAPKQGRAATGLWKARWRVAYTEGQNHHTEFPNLRYPSDSESGAEVQTLKLRLRERTRVRGGNSLC